MDKIICAGKNYLKHALELGDAVPTEPVLFIKPPSTVISVLENPEIELPAHGEVHHELELVLRLTRVGERWTFSHYTFGLDLTLRDIQSHLKKSGQPWEKAKVFKNAAILGNWIELGDLGAVMRMPFELKVNGVVRQSAHADEMRWKPDELIADAARWFPICEGDLLFTGTPEGVGPLNDGDRVEVKGGPVRYSFLCRVRP